MGKSLLVKRCVRFKQPASDRMLVVEGGGWVAVFGTIFLLPGLALVLIGFHLLPISGEDFLIHGVPVLGLFGVPFVLVGGWEVFGRRWITLDISRRCAVVQRGVLVPMFRNARRLDDFSEVTIQHQINESAEYYSVSLTAKANRKDISINDLNAYGDAYAQAAQLATFLRVPLIDASTDHPLELTPAEIQHPLQARLQSEAAVLEHIAPPTSLRSQVRDAAEGVQISIPGQVTSRSIYLIMLIAYFPAVFIIPIVLRNFYYQGQPPPTSSLYPFICFVLLLISLPFSPLLKAYLTARRTRTEVTVNKRGVTIEERRGNQTHHRTMIPIEDILYIDYGLTGMLSDSKGVA